MSEHTAENDVHPVSHVIAELVEAGVLTRVIPPGSASS